MYNDLLIQRPIVLVNAAKFDSIDESGMLQVCLRTRGAAGVSS